jgi:ABC-2 type transport system ATP-binding protein
MAGRAVDAADGPPPVIDVRDLVKRYRNAKTNAVDGISFAVGAGEFFALLGPNGAGKTTTISILTTTLGATSGRALINGHDIATQASLVRRSVGIIFQKPSLDLNLTGEENVRLHTVLYGLYRYAPSYRLMPAEYRRLLTGLADLLGISREIHAPVRTYSGGTRRKLEIVRSLTHRPRVLFLDEPTAGLDPPSRRTLWEHLASVRRESGTTIFLTTHYLEEAEQADRILVIDHGRVVADGSPAALKADLAREWVVIDAADRAGLRAELARLGVATTGDGPFRLPIGGPEVHAVLRAIATPLTEVRTHAPSLEDAYLEIVERAAGDRAAAGDEAGAAGTPAGASRPAGPVTDG